MMSIADKITRAKEEVLIKDADMSAFEVTKDEKEIVSAER